MKELLELKKKIAKKRSKYVRSDAYKRKRIKLHWRAPRGNQSKIRLKRRGKVSHPGPGVASPKEVRGLTRLGLRPVEVENNKQLEALDPKTEAAVIKRVGQKKRIELLKKATERKITVLNYKKPEEAIKQAEEKMKKKREAKKKKAETKKEKKEKAAKKTEEKKKKEEEQPAEEKPETAKGAKSDKIKTLEKRQ